MQRRAVSTEPEAPVDLAVSATQLLSGSFGKPRPTSAPNKSVFANVEERLSIVKKGRKKAVGEDEVIPPPLSPLKYTAVDAVPIPESAQSSVFFPVAHKPDDSEVEVMNELINEVLLALLAPSSADEFNHSLRDFRSAIPPTEEELSLGSIPM
eukprot:TRINITY_DN69777_c0_g1_i1.p2 TRINITY_DN69777_c0_g1~~TRINITY_DN69777_c0_g1_i1.p2  ORF type:complete len:153 (-),score=27.57 TRINITY_DN69777_c0_g1_i1:12-470(-)